MDNLVDLALLLVKLSLLSVGGTATVLADMQREMVARQWITPADFTQAYALTQLVPGPSSFVVIPLGYRIAGVAGGLIALLAFFLPPTLVGLGVVNVWHKVRESRWPKAIRSAVTPVVIGLILAGTYFMGRTAVRDVASLLIFAGAMYALLRTRVSTPLVMATVAVLGAIFLQS